MVDEYSWDQVLEAGLFVPGGVSSLRLANLSIYVRGLQNLHGTYPRMMEFCS